MLSRPFHTPKLIRWIGALVLVVLLCHVRGLASTDGRTIEDWALVRLDHVRKQKAKQLTEYCDQLRESANAAMKDRVVALFFLFNLEHEREVAKGAVPVAELDRVATIRRDFGSYYLQHYLAFYDFLFIDMDGNVFYTLRKESDYSVNLFNHTPRGKLAACLAEKPAQEAFVDFHEYGPSGEAAAFFVEPFFSEGDQVGWLVLQCSINKINTIFAWSQDLGRTGESFLVNQEGFMLTESNFRAWSAVLNQRLDNSNIQSKFSQHQGHKTVTDYRGATALTSFEVVPFMGTRWLAVAKVDRDEILTDHYAQYHWHYEEMMERALSDLRPVWSDGNSSQTVRSAGTLRVDMDEIIRAEPPQLLETFGISTCTGLIAADPGRCGYLAHISPRDAVYGGNATDLVRQMTMRLKTFDVRPCEMRDVSFYIIAPHAESVGAIVHALIEDGFMLSQIRLFCLPGAERARVVYDCEKDGLSVMWNMKGDPVKREQGLSEGIVVSDLLEQLMQAGGTAGTE